ncbi:vWA domain-containing protein [Parafilimonas sp.]|uniref:vWA domain-containing protein n=1 Tax=Parafilimonas sp. TaxID=1969739 RepID=UPI0039E5A916
MKTPDQFSQKVKNKTLLKHHIIKFAAFLSTILFIFCHAPKAAAQITITTTPADISSAIVGNSYNAVISATAANGNPVTLAVSPNIDAGSGLSFADPNPAAGTPLNLAGANPVAGSWSFSVIATATGEAAVGQDFTINVRKPIDLMLVLDKSGSMTSIVTGGSQSRWDALKSGVGLFFSNYQPSLTASNDAAGDQLGIRMFSTTDGPPVNAPFNVNQFVPVTRTANLATILDGDAPGGNTAMGPAVLSARNFLFPGGADNGHRKAMLVFTDGEQNMPPDVVASPGSNPTVSGTDVTNGDKIQIHAIGLGVAGSATQTLYNMAHESGVAPHIGISNIADGAAATPPVLNLSSYLVSISNQLYAGSTPQYVDVKRSNLKPLGTYYATVDSFMVSKRINQVFINFMCAVRNEARVSSITKDGYSLYLYDTSIVKIKSGPGWQTFIINVSNIKKKNPSFVSEGYWKIAAIAGTQSAAPYIMSLTVDDHNSEMIGTTTQTKELVVGDNLPLSIDFTKQGKPITNATALAVIGIPGEDLGDVLARNGNNIKISSDSDADNPGTQKLFELLKDSDFVKRLIDSNHAVTLTYDAAQKKYVGQFNHLDVSGVYQVAYIISANDTSLGEIKRYSEESVYIRFPEVNLDSSAINLTATATGGTLVFRPIGINGKYIGPGWASAIKIDGSPDTKLTNIADNGDGSYTLAIEGSLTDDVTVSIGTAKIYTGKLQDIGKPQEGGSEIWKQWWFWLILAIILLIIAIASGKKKP